MKKLLCLGGSTQQIPAIRYANTQGYHTILCDYIPDNPGIAYAKEFYCVSTTDMEAILSIAKEHNINGIIAYASDPAALTVAYVGKALGLQVNDYACVEILSKKNLFRMFLRESGFHSPMHQTILTEQEARYRKAIYPYPVMVKPTDSSGSKGVTKVERAEDMEEAYAYAKTYSREGKVIVEEYIQMDHCCMIAGDAFVLDHELVFFGGINSHRCTKGSPFIPIGNSFPLAVSPEREQLAKDTLQKAIRAVGFAQGAINFEIMITRENRVYLIEIGPRNGGNRIPEFLEEISGFNMVSASVEAALGNLSLTKEILAEHTMKGYYINYVIHSHKKGILQRVIVREEFAPYIISETRYIQDGKEVSVFDGSNKAIGILFFRFPTEAVYKDAMKVFEDLCQLEVMEVKEG